MKEVLERRAFRLQQTGNGFERPNTAPLMDGFHELRGRAARMQARLIFYFASGRRIIFVDAFYKQGDKITKKDLAKARKNKRLIEKEEERANVLSFIN
jgi:phage-related protein